MRKLAYIESAGSGFFLIVPKDDGSEVQFFVQDDNSAAFKTIESAHAMGSSAAGKETYREPEPEPRQAPEPEPKRERYSAAADFDDDNPGVAESFIGHGTPLGKAMSFIQSNPDAQEFVGGIFSSLNGASAKVQKMKQAEREARRRGKK